MLSVGIGEFHPMAKLHDFIYLRHWMTVLEFFMEEAKAKEN
jgi:hypothetical protein